MSDHTWENYGITWLEEVVSKTEGNTKVEMRGKAQIPSVTDLTKVIEHFGAESVMGSLNGTSWRVMAQDVCRRMLAANSSAKAEDIRTAVYNRLKGVRNAAVATRTVEVKVYRLPNGENFTPGNEGPAALATYKKVYREALIAIGTPADVAANISNSLTL